MHQSQRATAALLMGLLLAGTGCAQRGEDTATGDTAAGNTAPIPVILLGLDTVRGDHLRVAGKEDIATPYLDQLAADGVYFKECWSTAPWTGPSFASLFTGLWPYHHGYLGGAYMRLAPEHVTLAEHLDAAGYVNGEFVTIGWLTGACGMAQGFTEGEKVPDGPPGRQADGVTAGGLAFINRFGDRPFFLFLHYFDAHAPYTPPAPFDGMYYQGDKAASGTLLTDFLTSEQNLALNPDNKGQMYEWLEGVTDPEYPVKQYAAGVSHVDDHVGQVVAGLKQAGLYERALIIAVSDHGEHLGEHGFYYTHAVPFREALHVPLIIKWPQGRHAGRVVDQPVSTVDVLPTVLTALGRALPRDLDGHDLTPLLVDAGATHPTRPVAEEGHTPELMSKTIVSGDWKLLAYWREGEVYSSLFNLAQDPGETVDVVSEHPEVARRLLGHLSRLIDIERPLTVAEPLAALSRDDATQKKLRSLGYVH